MRYIKEYSEYYYKVPTYGMEWPKTVTPTPYDIKMVSILDSTINSLKLFLPEITGSRHFSADRRLYPYTLVRTYFSHIAYVKLNSSPTITDLVVYQYEDEWYLVQVVNTNIVGDSSDGYYWCDQLEGLMQLLKNIYLDKLLKESDKYYYPKDQFPLRPIGVSDLLSMSNAAIDAIKDLFPNTFVDYVEDKKYISVHNNPTIHIYQYDDEWYLARVNKQLNKSYTVKYYWCDQVEGVIQLLSYFYHDQNLNERI